ncbi:MAG: PKD domain-containing protein [Thermoplasmata archaeon]|nr:PKD domain-containing protein [Thermoplasmata archaeon]
MGTKIRVKKENVPVEIPTQKSPINSPILSLFVIVIIVALAAFTYFTPSNPVSPSADAGSDQTVFINENVTFNGTSIDEDGYIILFEWDFDGNGVFDWNNTEEGQASYIYQTLGNYTATLRITDNDNATATDTCTISVQPLPANASIRSHSSYIDPFSVFNIVGEVENTGTVNLDNIEITATYYDTNDSVIRINKTFSSLHIVKPGEKSCFWLYAHINQIIDYSYYTLEITYEETDIEPYDDFAILNDTVSYNNPLGWYQIDGEVKNIGNEIGISIELVFTGYDSNGTVIDAGPSTDVVQPATLNPGETGVFKLLIAEEYLAETIDHYDIQVQCS